jgi:ribosomal protein S18 acetylase RimI-like enzyme
MRRCEVEFHASALFNLFVLMEFGAIICRRCLEGDRVSCNLPTFRCFPSVIRFNWSAEGRLLYSKMTRMSEFRIRTLSPTDWAVYKLIRLASLADSPASFGSTYECEAQLPDSEWQSRLDTTGRAKNALPLIAEHDGVPVGLSWGLIHETDSGVAHIYQMWVAPEARGKGIGKSFLDHIAVWATAKNCDSLALSVTTTSDAAVGLYLSSGFVASGQVEELREGAALVIQSMMRGLHNTA